MYILPTIFGSTTQARISNYRVSCSIRSVKCLIVDLRFMIAALVLLIGSCGGSDNGGETRWFVHTPSENTFAVQQVVDEVVGDVEYVTGKKVTVTDLPASDCTGGEVHLVVFGHTDDETSTESPLELGPQEYSIVETRCVGGGRVVELGGGSTLAMQWAVYDLMHRLGVRYFHPERTFYPAAFSWPEETLNVVERPDFMRRSFAAHRLHPIELSAPTETEGLDMAFYQRRWVNWSLKMRQNVVNGWDEEFLGDYVWKCGFPRSAGINLVEAQQGKEPVLDPDDPRPESEQIIDAVDKALAPVEGKPDVSTFGFAYAPTEFTEVDPVTTLERINFITNYVTDNYPEVQVWLNNHGTAQDPVEPYGVRFGDLPGLGPPELNVSAHTLMFYDVSRGAAGVYGNENFNFLRDFMLEQQVNRRVEYFPEASWWLTFDLPVPLYLAPVTLEARQNDLDLLKPYLSSGPEATTGIYGHRLFTSGQEWGYWLIDYCVGRMTWNTDFGYCDCIKDFTDRLAGGAEIEKVLHDVAARQVVDMRDPDILRMLVGTDVESEAAIDIGIAFHPLPPPLSDLLGWNDAQVETFQSRSLEPLTQMALDYHAWADRIEALIPNQNEQQAPYVREIFDGLRVFAYRAEHSQTLYNAVLALRKGLHGGDADAVTHARDLANQAITITEAAAEVVRRREGDYLYPPELNIEGDETGMPGAVPNRTVYPFRVMSRTHRMYYWQRPDEQLMNLLDGVQQVQINGRVLEAGQSLLVTVFAERLEDVVVAWGDGEQADSLAPHTYTEHGVYTWRLEVTADGNPLSYNDEVAVVESYWVFPKGSLKFVEPAGASLIEGLFSGYIIGVGEDHAPFMLVAELNDNGLAKKGGFQKRPREGWSSGPAAFQVTVGALGSLTMSNAVLTFSEEDDPEGRHLMIEGELSSQEAIDLVLAFGGFDAPGATVFIADMFGYTPATLPERLPVVIEAVNEL